MGLWASLKRAFTPQPDGFGYSAAEMIDPMQAAAIEAARVSDQEPSSDADATDEKPCAAALNQGHAAPG